MPSEEIVRRMNEQLQAEMGDGIRRATSTATTGWSAEYMAAPSAQPSPVIRAHGYRHLRIDPLGSRGAPLDIWQLKGVVVLETGCFTGSLEQFAADVDSQHGDNIFGEEYAAALTFIRAWLALGAPRAEPAVEAAPPICRTTSIRYETMYGLPRTRHAIQVPAGTTGQEQSVAGGVV